MSKLSLNTGWGKRKDQEGKIKLFCMVVLHDCPQFCMVAFMIDSALLLFSCGFTSCWQSIFLGEHLWRAASEQKKITYNFSFILLQ